jgi:rubrerythrin
VSAHGYARDLTHLREDHAFEQEAVKRYGSMAAKAVEPELKALFRELVRGEAGHRRGLRRLIERVEDPATPVVLFCPLCGWELDFGPGPSDGTSAKCPMCPGRFALRLSAGGDWELERLEP